MTHVTKPELTVSIDVKLTSEDILDAVCRKFPDVASFQKLGVRVIHCTDRRMFSDHGEPRFQVLLELPGESIK